MLQLDLLFPIGLGVLLFAGPYWNHALQSASSTFRERLSAFTIGTTVSYLFLQLFPQSILAGDAAGYDLAAVTLFLCIGFLAMFLLDVAKEFHYAIRLALQLIIGMLLLIFFQFNMLQGWLFLAWAVLLSAYSPCAYGAIQKTSLRVAGAIAPLIGILATAFLPISVGWLIVLQVGVTGAFFYIAARELKGQSRNERIFTVVGAIVAGAALFLL